MLLVHLQKKTTRKTLRLIKNTPAKIKKHNNQKKKKDTQINFNKISCIFT
jgi:hypothetical protein